MTRKCLYLLGLCFALCTFTACQKHKSTMELTDFTKEAISVFINDSNFWWEEPYGCVNPKTEDILMYIYNDSTHYRLVLESKDKNDPWELLASDSIVIMGMTTYNGYDIIQIGPQSNLLFTNAVKPYKTIHFEEDMICIYDPYHVGIPISKETLMFDENYYRGQWGYGSSLQAKESIKALCEKYITPKQTTL